MKSPPNPHTRYYTIAGDWNPSLLSNCPQQFSQNFLYRIGKPTDFGYENAGFYQLNGTKGPNDGVSLLQIFDFAKQTKQFWNYSFYIQGQAG
jgi:hypothetical protein